MKVKVVLDGYRGRLVGVLPRDVRMDIESSCSYKVEGSEWSDAYKNHKWDGITRLYRNDKFPIGLLTRILAILTIHGVEYEVVDHRRIVNKLKPRSPKIVLREYQARVLRDALERKSGLIPVAVGGGKTEIAIGLIGTVGARTLFLVTTRDLLQQTKDRIEKALGVEVGTIGSGKFQPDHITVATWQAISPGLTKKEARVLDYLRSVDMLICDESHHLGSDKLYKLGIACPARYRYGLSGTMFRSDHGSELKMFGAIGEQIEGVTASELIDLDYLVPPTIRFIHTPPKFIDRWANFRQIYAVGVVGNEERNLTLAAEALKLVEEGRQTLVLVTEITHGEFFKKYLGWPFIHSAANDRSRLFQQFRDGEITGLISTPIFDEGVDLPRVSGIVLAGGGKSPIKAVQRVGRGLRKCDEIGKKDCVIIETNDTMRYLHIHSLERWYMYKKEPRFKIEGDLP